MVLVEIARFADLSEAQVAASVLRTSGMQVMLQNEHWGQALFHLQHAAGGFRIWVGAEDAKNAQAFIHEARNGFIATINRQDDEEFSPRVIGTGWRVAAGLSGLFSAPIGWTIWAAARRRRGNMAEILLGTLEQCPAAGTK